MDRRELLRRLSLSGAGLATSPLWARSLAALASADVPPPVVSTAADWTPLVLNAHQDQTVIALAEAIIPATDTPGATAAFVNRYVDALLDDGDEHVRKEFTKGLAWMDDRCRVLFGGDFLSSTHEQQTALLTILSSGKNHSALDQIGVEFFEDMKRKTIVGYYTSQVGMRDELHDDDLFFSEQTGCTHPEHGGPAPAAKAPRKKA